MPELLGRLPNRIELKALTRHDFKKVLTLVDNNLQFQQIELLKTENINIDFTDAGIDYLCLKAEELNLATENIGARRLHSLIEKIVEDISFEGPDSVQKSFVIDEEFIEEKLKSVAIKADYSRYML